MNLLDAIRSPGENSTPAAPGRYAEQRNIRLGRRNPRQPLRHSLAEYAHRIVNLFDDAIVNEKIRQVL